MKQSDLFLQSEGDAFYERNKDKPRLPDPVIEAMQACQLQPKNVLELGCGNGWRLDEIKKQWPNAHVRGYDPSKEATRMRNDAFADDALLALRYIGDARYDTVIFGFCLYLVDREDLMMIAAHTDRVLQNKGHIVIHDFHDGDVPFKRKYKHREGVWSYHMDYCQLWVPSYKLITRMVGHDDTMVTIVHKDIAAGWPERAE